MQRHAVSCKPRLTLTRVSAAGVPFDNLNASRLNVPERDAGEQLILLNVPKKKL